MVTASLPSRTSSQQYTVCLNDDGTSTCSCTAGSFGKPCWHVKTLAAESERQGAWPVSGAGWPASKAAPTATRRASAITRPCCVRPESVSQRWSANPPGVQGAGVYQPHRLDTGAREGRRDGVDGARRQQCNPQ